MRALLLLAVAMSITSFAQTKKAEPKEIIFGDGDLIDGDLSKPDVEYIGTGVKVEHTSLIRVRETFKEKVMESAREL